MLLPTVCQKSKLYGFFVFFLRYLLVLSQLCLHSLMVLGSSELFVVVYLGWLCDIILLSLWLFLLVTSTPQGSPCSVQIPSAYAISSARLRKWTWLLMVPMDEPVEVQCPINLHVRPGESSIKIRWYPRSSRGVCRGLMIHIVQYSKQTILLLINHMVCITCPVRVKWSFSFVFLSSDTEVRSSPCSLNFLASFLKPFLLQHFLTISNVPTDE